ncbi:MAG: methyltransferase [bacterium]|nr:MAG: methyltransferase [bacterium]
MSYYYQTCPYCPSGMTKRLFTAQSGGNVVQCLECELQFVEMYPDIKESILKIYSAEYFKHMIERTVQRKKNFNKLIYQLESILDRKGRLLEIGAGEGTLLQVALERGWEVEGTEISPAAIEHIQNNFPVKMYQGNLEEIPLEPCSYDAVVLNHVLEHVRNPKTTLEKVGKLVRGNGVVRIEIPNIASLSCRLKNVQSRLKLKRNPWKHYGIGHHFWFFTPKTLRNALEAAGLAVMKMETPAPQKLKFFGRSLNDIYKQKLLGGALVVFARKKQVSLRRPGS